MITIRYKVTDNRIQCWVFDTRMNRKMYTLIKESQTKNPKREAKNMAHAIKRGYKDQKVKVQIRY